MWFYCGCRVLRRLMSHALNAILRGKSSFIAVFFKNLFYAAKKIKWRSLSNRSFFFRWCFRVRIISFARSVLSQRNIACTNLEIRSKSSKISFTKSMNVSFSFHPHDYKINNVPKKPQRCVHFTLLAWQVLTVNRSKNGLLSAQIKRSQCSLPIPPQYVRRPGNATRPSRASR